MSYNLGFSPSFTSAPSPCPFTLCSTTAGRILFMRNMPTKAPNRRPAAIHTRIRGGPPADWKSDVKPEVGGIVVAAETELVVVAISGYVAGRKEGVVVKVRMS